MLDDRIDNILEEEKREKGKEEQQQDDSERKKDRYLSKVESKNARK